MNFKHLLLVALIALVGFQSCSSDDDAGSNTPIVEDEIVVIVDATLESIILENLGLSSASDLTKEKIEQLQAVDLNGTGVTTLEGIENASNLVEFSARTTSIEDFSYLSDLTALKKVDIENAAIPENSVGFLQNLTNLEFLNLRGTQVADISVLSNKNNLVHLNLRQSHVTNVSSLSNLTQLQYLNLNRTGPNSEGIDDVTPLENLHNLYYLSLRNTQMGDAGFAMFENFTQLVESNIRNTGITDLTPLVAIFEAGGFLDGTPFDNKVSLDIQNNDITNPCIIEPWVNQFEPGELEGWDGASCEELEDPELFEDAAFEALVRTILGVDATTELTTELLESITELDARGSGTSNIAGIGLMPNITFLRLDNTNVTDLSPIIELENLTYFNINSVEGITDISPLANNTNLEVLIARNIPFGNEGLETIQNFNSLWRLNMRNTGVTDLSILATMMENGALQNAANPEGDAVLDIRNIEADFCVIFPYINEIGDLSGGNFDGCE